MPVAKPSSSDTVELSAATETALWAAYGRCSHDEDVLARLLEFYLPLVERVVRRVAMRIYWQVEPRELLGAGVLGLHEAIRRYAAERGVAFRAYAAVRIRGAVLDELRARDHLTSRQRRAVKRVQGIVAELTRRHQRPPADDEIAREAGLPEDEVSALLALGAGTVRLDDDIDGGLRYQDVLADDTVEAPDRHADTVFGLESMRRAIRQLEPRDQQLLFFRHHEQLSVKEIAAVFDLTPGRVSQLYGSVVLKLRDLMGIESGQGLAHRPCGSAGGCAGA